MSESEQEVAAIKRAMRDEYVHVGIEVSDESLTALAWGRWAKLHTNQELGDWVMALCAGIAPRNGHANALLTEVYWRLNPKKRKS